MDRGQAHTLEAFMAALLVVGGVVFALQATAVTPLSASTSNQNIQNQLRTVANDLLAVAAENGSLRDAVLYWNTSSNGFEDAADNGRYSNGGPTNEFGRLLNETFRDQRIAFNVYVGYWDGDSFSEETMVFMGTPSDNAVAASRMVPVFNESRLMGSNTTTVSVAANDDNFYASDALAGNELFNVMEVRIVVWRM